jgi:hypothetical protein
VEGRDVDKNGMSHFFTVLQNRSGLNNRSGKQGMLEFMYLDGTIDSSENVKEMHVTNQFSKWVTSVIRN